MSDTIDPKLIDVTLPEHDGYPEHFEDQDTFDQLCGAASEAGAIVTAFPKHLWIEPKDWPAVAAENDANKTWPINFRDRFTNQNPTHECTCHSLCAVAEVAWNRQRQIAVGPPAAGERLAISAQSASVWFSCLGIYSEANPRQWGGAGVRQVLSIAARRGFLPDKIQPREYGFKHSLQGTCGNGGVNQSSGPWVSLSKFPDGWEETAKHFKPLEYIFPESWEQTVCLVLNGYAVGVGREGHAVPYMRWYPKDQLMAYTDSYDVIRYDSISRIKKTVGGAFAIATFTQPDDWNKPAG